MMENFKANWKGFKSVVHYCKYLGKDNIVIKNPERDHYNIVKQARLDMYQPDWVKYHAGMDILLEERPIITLSNGKRVMNFSSPHPFRFTDGSILPAVSKECSEALAVRFIEYKPDKPYEHLEDDVSLSFEITPDIQATIQYFVEDGTFHKDVDVCFCPLPMITALKESAHYGYERLRDSPLRCIRMKSRTEKLVCIDKQTL